MLKVIIRYGLIAGAIAAIPWIWLLARLPADAGLESMYGYARSYLIMLVALSMVFVGIKQYRDQALGGVIKFGPALLVGLGISTIAGVFYAVAWEICTAFMRFDFVAFYAKEIVEQARTAGANEQAMAAAAANAANFTEMYTNPLFRIPMTFLEIFPVGILVSLISAALLKNSRFLPARA